VTSPDRAVGVTCWTRGDGPFRWRHDRRLDPCVPDLSHL
jgi:hypothetical protein